MWYDIQVLYMSFDVTHGMQSWQQPLFGCVYWKDKSDYFSDSHTCELPLYLHSNHCRSTNLVWWDYKDCSSCGGLCRRAWLQTLYCTFQIIWKWKTIWQSAIWNAWVLKAVWRILVVKCRIYKPVTMRHSFPINHHEALQSHHQTSIK